jgi:hypothetical protein
MTYSESVLESVDDNGTISWEEASLAAAIHGLLTPFLSHYYTLMNERIDAGELLVWLGY